MGLKHQAIGVVMDLHAQTTAHKKTAEYEATPMSEKMLPFQLKIENFDSKEKTKTLVAPVIMRAIYVR